MRRTIDLSERLESDLATEVDRRHPLILDPFCGTGTVLQEALLAGYDVVGTDLSQKIVDYTTENLSWLQSTFTAPSHPIGRVIDIHQADAAMSRKAVRPRAWMTRMTSSHCAGVRS